MNDIVTPTRYAQQRPLRITVVGAGAIGGALAIRLANVGHRVSVLARGATLAALREGPASLTDLDGLHRADLDAYDSDCSDGGDCAAGAAAIGPQDLVILAVKAQSLPALVPTLAPLLGLNTRVMPAVNGLPWWYFQGRGVASRGPHDMLAVAGSRGAPANDTIAAVDPDGVLWRSIAPGRIIGTVVYMTGAMPCAGVYVASNPHRLIIGAIAEGGSDADTLPWDAPDLAAVFNAAGIATQASADIRMEIWAKLAGNLTSNPLSVLTGATLAQIYSAPDLLLTVRPMLREIRALSEALSVTLPFDDEAFLARCRGMGPIKTSMLQDAERGRPLELAAIGDAALEMAARVDVAMPVTAAILGLVRQRVSRPVSH
jgi:2-dehydropantoate 2-reductase